MKSRSAFTLIELLIVIAIIAILALIAIPNFLEAQVRAKVSRAMADLRSIATALEAYMVDRNTYPPNDGLYNAVPVELTTPIAYISDVMMIDPFATGINKQISASGNIAPYYTYMKIVTLQESIQSAAAGRVCPNEAIDFWNPNAFLKYGGWRMVSIGPDRMYCYRAGFPAPLYGSDVLYDPSNGTISFGNILRTQIK
ncbi:MAG: prepilin-type N-terminal cleavage/methylation domain-containing protein [Candidatus Sumerlaeota bacterium]|nr:prepilin-type N-terminal cleavage/methylation domain-containing protein [Candidatus Sumerlaeota bacterium]